MKADDRNSMNFENVYFITGTAYAGKSTMVHLLADPEISVRRFFERPDREKQFLYRLILEEPDPEAAMENYRQGLARINSRERYERFLHSGFPVILRDESRRVEETLALVERAFGLRQAACIFPNPDQEGARNDVR